MQDEDVTKLTDEELQARIDGKEPEEPEKEVAEPADSEEKPSEEELEATEEPETPETPEEQQVPTAPEVPAEEESPTEEPKPPSRREQLRIQDILKKREQAQPSQPSQQPMNYGDALDADPETIRQLEFDREQYAAQTRQYSVDLNKSMQFRNRLELDSSKVESKYTFLDKKSADFDPVRADAMNTLYLDTIGFSAGNPDEGIPDQIQNPSLRYPDFVEAQMEFAEALMADRQRKSVDNISKQAAQTGLRPDGGSAKSLNLNKAPEDMTDEELQAVLKKHGLATKK